MPLPAHMSKTWDQSIAMNRVWFAKTASLMEELVDHYLMSCHFKGPDCKRHSSTKCPSCDAPLANKTVPLVSVVIGRAWQSVGEWWSHKRRNGSGRLLTSKVDGQEPWTPGGVQKGSTGRFVYEHIATSGTVLPFRCHYRQDKAGTREGNKEQYLELEQTKAMPME